MSFSHVHNSSSPTNAVTQNVTAGDLVVVHTMATINVGGVVSVSVSDGSRTLTLTPSSPVKSGTPSTDMWTAIAWYIASQTASLTYTATWSGSGLVDKAIFLEEFAFTGAEVVFDTDITYTTGNTAEATPITKPSISPSAAGELLVAAAFSAGVQAGSVGIWQAGLSTAGLKNEYKVNGAAGGTAVNWSDNANPDTWVAIAAAFADTDVVRATARFRLVG